MVSKPLAFGLLAVLCVVAAGGGAYVATRQLATRPAGAAESGIVAPLTSSGQPAAVMGTEGEVKAAPPTEAQTPAASSQPTGPVPSDRDLTQAQTDRPQPTAEQRTRTRGEPASASPITVAPPLSRAETQADPGAGASQKPWTGGSATQPPDGQPTALAVSVPEPPQAPERTEPPAKEYDELVVSPDSVIGLQIEAPVTSERARVEDPVEGRVSREVRVAGRVAIPAGARVLGSVTLVERGGKVKERARLGIRFHTLILADGTHTPITTDTVFREGESPTGQSSAKIGGATVGGAILGAILGGGRGAAIGGSLGAAGGAAAVMSGPRNTATFPAGATVTVRLQAPITVMVERD
jgi:hypothetical protein